MLITNLPFYVEILGDRGEALWNPHILSKFIELKKASWIYMVVLVVPDFVGTLTSAFHGSNGRDEVSSHIKFSRETTCVQQKMAYGRIIILEGNISAGKSTLCDALKKANPNARAFFEPTATNPYLERFYVDPPRYALKMQMWLFRQRYMTYLEALRYVMETGYDAILDRSVYSDWVFAQNGFLDGNITLEGYQYYMSLRQHLLADLPLPHFTVYLRVEPEICHNRIHNLRKRGCESSIPLEYLQGLHVCYERLLKELNEHGSAVLAFDWNSFGSASEVMNHLGRYTFEYSQPQWDRVRLLLNQLERVDVNEHMWPKHLAQQAEMFDEQEHSVTASMEEERMALEKERGEQEETEEDEVEMENSSEEEALSEEEFEELERMEGKKIGGNEDACRLSVRSPHSGGNVRVRMCQIPSS